MLCSAFQDQTRRRTGTGYNYYVQEKVSKITAAEKTLLKNTTF